ncbi:caspase family protein [Paraburkholderia sp. BR10954]|uniref:caspase family protein n=1 Tax=Paraburkholderia sp. BR10954 TaxID=3236995 RepID=UPI0034D187EA
MDWIRTRLGQREARTKIIILDACRDMPKALRFKSLGESGGLSELKNLRPGTRVIYATSPDFPALSAPNGQRNSIFTAALLKAIREKPATFNDVLDRAAEITLEATGNKQSPWSTGNFLSFKLAPQLPTNPLSQSKANIVPRTNKSNQSRSSDACVEISEQIIVNGVSMWTKKCVQ